MINGGTEEPRFCGGLIQMCNVENALRDVQRRTTELPVRYAQGSHKSEKIHSGQNCWLLLTMYISYYLKHLMVGLLFSFDLILQELFWTVRLAFLEK